MKIINIVVLYTPTYDSRLLTAYILNLQKALDEHLEMRKDRKKLVDRWTAEVVRDWMAEGGFPSNVAQFLDGSNGKTILAIAQALKDKEGEKLVEILVEIRQRRRICGNGEMSMPASAEALGGRGGGGRNPSLANIRSETTIEGEDESMTIAMPLFILNMKRTFLDLVMEPKPKPRESTTKHKLSNAAASPTPKTPKTPKAESLIGTGPSSRTPTLEAGPIFKYDLVD